MVICTTVLAIAFLLYATSATLLADGTNAAPVAPQPAPAAGEDFGQYLVDHGDILGPFFEKNKEELMKQSVPMVLGLLGSIMFFTLIVGWIIDVLLVRAFTPFFAPAYTKIKRAIVYATGQLVLSVVAVTLIFMTIIYGSGLPNSAIIVLLGVSLIVLVSLAIEIGWICYLFGMNIPSAIMFFVILVGAHAFSFVLISAPIIGGRPSALAYAFVNQKLTPQLQTEVDIAKQDLAAAQASRDTVKANIADLQNQIAQAQADQDKIRAEIESRKNSEVYVFDQIVKLRAQGQLTQARDQLVALLAKFPSGPITDQVQTQLGQISSELAVQEAQKKQADADAALAAAQARADLLARAGKGEVTLSEMRRALIGKAPADVSALCGQPSAIASDCWGYGQQMVVDPMTNEKHGLTVYFAEGTVQSVDYYYGAAK